VICVRDGMSRMSFNVSALGLLTRPLDGQLEAAEVRFHERLLAGC
jgi:hypothetical protein